MGNTNLTASDKETLMSQRKAHLLNLLRMDAPDFMIAMQCGLVLRGFADEDAGKARLMIWERKD